MVSSRRGYGAPGVTRRFSCHFPTRVTPVSGHRRPSLLIGLGLIGLAAVAVGGCRGRAQNSSATAADTRVGVVDLQVVTHAHPRWQDLDVLVQEEKNVQAELAMIPQPPALPAAEVQRVLGEEAKHLRVELEKEVEFLRVEGRRQIEAFANELRTEAEARLAQLQHDLRAQGEEELVAKRDAMRTQLRAAEQAIRDEYRYPLLNLRLRAEVAGLSSEAEGKQLLQEMQALQDERDTRIQEKLDELQSAFSEFQKAKESEINAKLKAEQDALEAEDRQRLAARQQAAQADFARAATDLEKTYQARLERRRQEIISGAQGPFPGRQGTYTQSLIERGRQLQSELEALREKRQRLEDSILAEVKIDVATIAQTHKLDVVLTRYVSNVAGIDITADVVARLKQ
jgi:Skp family chaperone for outer membrane proteins